MNAYGILSNSSNESGCIPLSELKCYKDNFGLIGSFDEFVVIIYAISYCYSKHRNKDSGKDNNTAPTVVAKVN